jgi:hypothetical protein
VKREIVSIWLGNSAKKNPEENQMIFWKKKNEN